MSARTFVSERDPGLRWAFAGAMVVAIALVGYLMMTVGSSPSVKGASFIWLPAALQLVAGVWLGPWLGFFVGGVGAQLAGVLAYGGWSTQDWIMNFVAGGFANAMLPALLFRWLGIDPTFGVKSMSAVLSGAVRVVVLAVLVLAAGLVNIVLGLPVPWGLLLPLVVLVVGWWWLLGGMKLNASHFTAAVLIAVLACVVSAFIGALGATVGGKPFAAALVDPGIGWLAGDTVSAILGLALLPLYTARLVRAGIAKLS